jgi:hypothetical protein
MSAKEEEWKLLKEFPENKINEFCNFFFTETLLKTKLLSQKLQVNSKVKWNKSQSRMTSPRLSRTLENFSFDEITVANESQKHVFLYEILYCKGQKFKTAIEAKKAATEKRTTKKEREKAENEKTEEERRKEKEKEVEEEEKLKQSICFGENCNFQVKWIFIQKKDGKFFQIYRRGRHCEVWTELFRRDLQLRPEITQKIQDYFYLLLPPSRVLTILSAEANKKDIPAQDITQRPTLAKIQNLYGNWRRNREPDVSETKEILLKKKKLQSDYEVLYPTNENEAPDPPNDWFLVISTKELLQELKKYGKEKIHLDSIFKLTMYRLPVWSVINKRKKKKNSSLKKKIRH